MATDISRDKKCRSGPAPEPHMASAGGTPLSFPCSQRTANYFFNKRHFASTRYLGTGVNGALRLRRYGMKILSQSPQFTSRLRASCRRLSPGNPSQAGLLGSPSGWVSRCITMSEMGHAPKYSK
jgi:hypothetical protein